MGHLLSILKVTKQSISRVLKDLIEQAYVEQKSEAAIAASAGCGSPKKARSSSAT